MSPTAELAGRINWALGRLSHVINIGREAGWLAGSLLGGGDALIDPAVDDASPMQVAASRLDLSAEEVDLLWLLVCIEIDPAVSRAAELLLSSGMHELSAQMLERLVAGGGVLEAEMFERLERLALIHTSLDARVPLHRRPVRVDDRVIDLARGRLALDRGLRDVASLESAIDIRRTSIGKTISVPESISHALTSAHPPVVVTTGVEGSGRSTILRQAASSAGRGVLMVRARELASDEAAFVRQLRSIARECCLHDAWPVLVDADCLGERTALLDRELISVLEAPVLATSRETCAWSISRPVVTVPVRLPDAAARAAMWRQAMPSASPDVIEACAARYTVSAGLIQRGAATAMSLVPDQSHVDLQAVHVGLRAQLERRLAGLARRIETRQTWDDLVLPVDQFDVLIELVARVRHRNRVLDQWGFADKVGRGLGLSALLSGPPGTGKTMVAGLVAQELGLDLYQVDLSKVVSKYIGETEKQLSTLFEAAESGHAIILFDEADSLFAKRTEVKSSNDRYANLEVNYLLQRIESFSGITLLTTNHETAIDQAFLRRLAFHVRVPMPEEREREQLWRAMLPERAERSSDIAFEQLATKFVMSGGYIKNAVLRAAFLSAEDGTPISNDHMWRAARAEYEAMGKVTYQARL